MYQTCRVTREQDKGGTLSELQLRAANLVQFKRFSATIPNCIKIKTEVLYRRSLAKVIDLQKDPPSLLLQAHDRKIPVSGDELAYVVPTWKCPECIPQEAPEVTHTPDPEEFSDVSSDDHESDSEMRSFTIKRSSATIPKRVVIGTKVIYKRSVATVVDIQTEPPSLHHTLYIFSVVYVFR